MSLHLKDKLQSSIVNTVFYPLFVKAAAFYSTDECIGCGLCETLRPLKNIQLAKVNIKSCNAQVFVTAFHKYSPILLFLFCLISSTVLIAIISPPR